MLLGLNDKLHFGKYAGCTVRELALNHLEYFEWATDSKIIELSDEDEAVIWEEIDGKHGWGTGCNDDTGISVTDTF
jgi:hypothetical protein